MADVHERVAAYLDDQLQTHADLQQLDHLLSNIRTQHGLLQQQLEQAEKDAHDARAEADEHHRQLRQQHHQFERDQHDIDRRLQIVTLSDASDDAVARFEQSMAKLHTLEIAARYGQRLREVGQLSAASGDALNTSGEAALESYRQLKALDARLAPLHEAAEGAAPHLIDHIARTTQHVRGHLRDAFSKELDAVLKKIDWPKRPETTFLGSLQEQWAAAVGKLLDLQMPELEAAENAAAGPKGSKAPLVLLPFEVLVQPLEMRFRYHFEGDKPTNRLDKPEYFLSHIVDLLNNYNPFVVDNLQPILLSQFRGTDLGLNAAYIDATSAFITALLPMLRSKIFSTLPKVANQPQLLSHLMHEVMNFDTSLKEDWRYDGGNGAEGWKGLAWEVLVSQDWFGRWLQVEKDFALARYQSIIDTADSGELDYDSVDPGATKPTKAAIRVNDLLETITDRYRPLSSFSQKLSFLIDVQISIFDRFHERLHSSLEAYLTMTSSVGRAVQGISREEQANLQGVAGLDRLCRVFGSADYLERAMRDWSDDVFFLELWDELQDRARRRRSTNLAGPLSVAAVAERTSSAVGSEEDTGALFDETAGAYNRLRVRSEAIIADQLTYNIRESLRAYRNINPWATLSNSTSFTAVPQSSANNITPELEPLLSYLTSSFAFLHRALARAPLRRIAREAAKAIEQGVWDGILMRHSFSTAGAAQLKADIGAVGEVLDRWVGEGCAAGGLRKVREGVALLGLPVRGKGAAGVEEEEGGGGGSDAGGQMALWDVEKRVFADNEQARQVLEELGFDSLTEAEARAVLERRVELGS
ncbi:RINT-1/TIP-1 domain-containing protein [Macrophomina phaseolina MS6]|uniref:RINT-1/TIP-1 domain-containing protein n=1 Tax=Macrophomina phaseolina (strain MS6) TaxID=1126212 RepID=K2SJP5_MACPH|nr:RINT-1/TIP-1 domain-containing protein [Macrophomina phaseolina MS6]